MSTAAAAAVEADASRGEEARTERAGGSRQTAGANRRVSCVEETAACGFSGSRLYLIPPLLPLPLWLTLVDRRRGEIVMVAMLRRLMERAFSTGRIVTQVDSAGGRPPIRPPCLAAMKPMACCRFLASMATTRGAGG